MKIKTKYSNRREEPFLKANIPILKRPEKVKKNQAALYHKLEAIKGIMILPAGFVNFNVTHLFFLI